VCFGLDGLVLEGYEGGRFENPDGPYGTKQPCRFHLIFNISNIVLDGVAQDTHSINFNFDNITWLHEELGSSLISHTAWRATHNHIAWFKWNEG
jgi:hypothetical protein